MLPPGKQLTSISESQDARQKLISKLSPLLIYQPVESPVVRQSSDSWVSFRPLSSSATSVYGTSVNRSSPTPEVSLSGDHDVEPTGVVNDSTPTNAVCHPDATLELDFHNLSMEIDGNGSVLFDPLTENSSVTPVSSRGSAAIQYEPATPLARNSCGITLTEFPLNTSRLPTGACVNCNRPWSQLPQRRMSLSDPRV